MLILLIDDHVVTLDTLSILLESWNHQVVVASSIEGALERIRSEPIDIVFTELRLGLRSGEEIIEFLRPARNPECHSSIPIYLMATHVDAVDLPRIKSRVDKILIKPFPLGSLLGLVSTASEKRDEHV